VGVGVVDRGLEGEGESQRVRDMGGGGGGSEGGRKVERGASLFHPCPHLTSIDWRLVSAVRLDDSAVAPSARRFHPLQMVTGRQTATVYLY
jgi:hypothetical protein